MNCLYKLTMFSNPVIFSIRVIPKNMSYVWALCVLCCLSTAHSFSSGRCPDLQVQENLNIDQYLGTWYEAELFSNVFELGTRCVSDTYSRLPNGDIELFYNRIGKWTGTNRTTSGILTIPDPSVPAKLEASFSNWIPSGKYWVIDTDYENYSLVYTCVDYSFFYRNFHTDIAWIITRRRTRGLDMSVRSRLYALLDSNGVDTTRFTQSDQTNCVSQNNSI